MILSVFILLGTSLMLEFSRRVSFRRVQRYGCPPGLTGTAPVAVSGTGETGACTTGVHAGVSRMRVWRID